jgi:hypothetical protein
MAQGSKNMQPGLMKTLTGAVGKDTVKPINLPGATETVRRTATGKTIQSPSNVNPQSIIERVSGSKYAPILTRALERGTRNFAVTNYLLQSQDENYRNKTIEQE